jgi:hypothetical protein
MDLFPSHIITRLPLSVPDLLRLGATCRRFQAAIDENIATRLDIRVPISCVSSELVSSKWDALKSLQVFLETTTRIEPYRMTFPLPRRFDALTRLHLRAINLPVDATTFWTRIFEMAPLLARLVVDIATYPKMRAITYAHIESLLKIGAPRLVDLGIRECGALILGSAGGHARRVESDTLKSLRITGLHAPHTCIDAPLTSAVIEEITSGLQCLGPRSFDTLMHLEMIVHHACDMIRVRSFTRLKKLRVTLHGSNDAAIVLLGEISNKLGGTPLEDIDLVFDALGTNHNASWNAQPRVTFHDVFRNLAHLKTLRIRFHTTPTWITDFVCAIEAPSLSRLYLESDDFGSGLGGISARRYGLLSGTLDAARLRVHLEQHPALHISTKNVSHS